MICSLKSNTEGPYPGLTLRLPPQASVNQIARKRASFSYRTNRYFFGLGVARRLTPCFRLFSILVSVLALALLLVGFQESPCLRQHGLDLYAAGKYTDAAATLEPCVQHEKVGSPEYLESALVLGQSYFMLSQAPKAIPWLEKLPESTEANYMLGYAYLQNGQPDRSEVAFARLFSQLPDSARGHLIAAQMMLKKDYDQEAARELETALKLDPNLPQAHFLLGEIDIFRGRLDQAIENLRKETSRNPSFAQAWYRLGDAYIRKESWNEAVPNLQRAVWLSPEFSGSYILLGKAYLKQGNYSNAEGILRRAVSLDPNNQSANYLLGQTLMAEGKQDEGRAVLEKLRKK